MLAARSAGSAHKRRDPACFCPAELAQDDQTLRPEVVGIATGSWTKCRARHFVHPLPELDVGGYETVD